MKVLYESVISANERHRLGEYYTPDWLAEEIVSQVVTDPLAQRVLDPGCGSGTFLFHAVRRYLAPQPQPGRRTRMRSAALSATSPASTCTRWR